MLNNCKSFVRDQKLTLFSRKVFIISAAEVVLFLIFENQRGNVEYVGGLANIRRWKTIHGETSPHPDFHFIQVFFHTIHPSIVSVINDLASLLHVMVPERIANELDEQKKMVPSCQRIAIARVTFSNARVNTQNTFVDTLSHCLAPESDCV